MFFPAIASGFPLNAVQPASYGLNDVTVEQYAQHVSKKLRNICVTIPSALNEARRKPMGAGAAAALTWRGDEVAFNHHE